MALTYVKGSQIRDNSIERGKLVDNFVQNATWQLSDNNSAVLTGLALPDGTVNNQAATVEYVKNLVDSNLKAPDGFATTASGDYPSDYKGTGTVSEGDMFYVTDVTNGTTVGTRTVNLGDALVALVDNPGNTDANWLIMESNRDQATESVKGVIEIATQAETDAGTDDERAVTPLKLATYLSNAGIQSYQYGNGLSVDASTDPDTVVLGGTLDRNTSIDINGNDLTFGGVGGVVTITGDNTVIGSSVNSAILQAHPDGTQDFAIADVKYVKDQVIAGVTASNGLTKTGGDIQLGGDLTQDTTVSANGHEFYLGAGGGLVEIGGVDGSNVRSSFSADTINYGTGHTQMTASDGTNWTRLVLEGPDTATVGGNSGNFPGMQYETDYSANYTNRSLVDKEYVDTQISNSTREVFNELPSVTGGSTDVTLANTPLANTERVFRNGVRMAPGAGNDYTISGNTITFATALDATDIVLVDYKY